MAYYYVKISNLRSAADEISQVRSKFVLYGDSVKSNSGKISSTIRSSLNIGTRLDKLGTVAGVVLDGLKSSSTTLNTISEEYAKCEQRIVDGSNDIRAKVEETANSIIGSINSIGGIIKKPIISSAGGGVATIISSFWNANSQWAGGLINKVLGKAGAVGAIAKSVNDGFKNGWNVEDIIGAGNGGLTGATIIAKDIAKNGKFDWKALIGLTASEGSTATTTWGKLVGNFGKEVDKYNFGKATGVAGKLGVAAKWVDVGIKAYKNGKKYFGESDGSAEGYIRAGSKTVASTAAEVGVAWGGAALAATILGPGAPVVAVGALGVGIAWGADKGLRWLTKTIGGEEKGFGDIAADAADWVVDRAKDVGNFIVDTGKKAVEGVKNIFGGAASLVKKGVSVLWGG